MPSRPPPKPAGNSTSSPQRLPFHDAPDEEFHTEHSGSPASANRTIPKGTRSRSSSLSQAQLPIPFSYNQRQPTRSYFQHASFSGTEPQYSSQGVRDQTEELATSFRETLGSFCSSGSPARRTYSESETDTRRQPLLELSDSEHGGGRGSVDSARPYAIEEVSEPASPEFPATAPQRPDPKSSNLTYLIQTSPPNERVEESDNEDNEDAEVDRRGVPEISPAPRSSPTLNERSPLIPKATTTSYKSGDHEEPSAGGQSLRKRRTVEKVKDFTGNTFRTMTSAKTWNVQNVRQGAVAVWATGPAVFLGLLLNILDALSYGTILFPLGDTIFEDTAPDGIAMFFVSTIVAQLVYVLMSKFKGGIGSEMIEVVPFVHKMTFVIINEIGRENPKA
ncbi:hypothetical protein LTS18_006547, partial [Coniosporium uncinatum]